MILFIVFVPVNFFPGLNFYFLITFLSSTKTGVLALRECGHKLNYLCGCL